MSELGRHLPSQPSRPSETPRENRRRSYVIRPRYRDDDPSVFRHLIVLIIVLVILLGCAATRYSVEVSLAFQLEDMQNRLQLAQDETKRMGMDINRRSSLESIRERAKLLGFAEPRPDQRVRLNVLP